MEPFPCHGKVFSECDSRSFRHFMIQIGYYEHFKGGLYKVIGLAEHTESGEQLVLYCPVEQQSKVWARPISMFLESVEHQGKKVQRFQFLRS